MVLAFSGAAGSDRTAHPTTTFSFSGSGRARIENDEFEFQAGDTPILPAGKVHQLFAETDGESIAAMPIGSVIRTPAGR